MIALNYVKPRLIGRRSSVVPLSLHFPKVTLNFYNGIIFIQKLLSCMTISLNEVFMDLFIKYNLLLKLIYDYVNYSFNKNIVEIFYDFHVRRGKKVTCEYSRVQMLIETF